jgi:hypothetical protein
MRDSARRIIIQSTMFAEIKVINTILEIKRAIVF